VKIRFLHQPQPHLAGFFRSRGIGCHPERIIDSYELIFVRQGVLGISEGATNFLVQAGETLILRPGIRHHGTHDYQADLRFFWGHFEPGSRRLGGGVLRVPQHGSARDPERLAELFGHYLDEQERGFPCRRTASWLIEGWLLESGHPARSAEASEGSALARLATESAATRFAEVSFGPSLIAADLQMNPDYLERVFKRSTGHTLGSEILRRRLAHARKLLRESPLNIEQIARSCGFANAGWFRRVFQRESGLGPLAYRQQFARALINVD